MNSRHFCLAFSAFLMAGSLGLVGFAHTVAGDISTTLPSWVDAQPTINKVEDIGDTEYVELRMGNFPCEYVDAHYWGYNPSGNPLQPKLEYTSQGCNIPMASGDYDAGNNAVVPFGEKHIQHLRPQNLTNFSIFPARYTNRLAIVSNSYNYVNTGTPTLNLVDDWTTTFNDFQLDSYDNVDRYMSKPVDFTLTNTDGSPVDVRTNGLRFSANGDWLHAGATDKSEFVINTSTHEIVPFAPYLDTGDATGAPKTKLAAVSNDGRYVAIDTQDFGLRVYDLTKCSAAGNFLESRDCQHNDTLYQTLETFAGSDNLGILHMDFVGSDNALEISADVHHVGDNSWTHEKYRLTLPGVQPSKYLAMGDSFSSGEGAYDYRPETNFYNSVQNFNICHQSKQSYPYLLQNSAQFDDFGSVACSGAQSKDVFYLPAHVSTGSKKVYATNSSQAAGMSDGSLDNEIYSDLLPGYREQADFISKFNPSVITIGIGGNDAGFGPIIESCITDAIDCYSDSGERYLLSTSIDANIVSLKKAIMKIKQDMPSNGRIYLVGYPEAINPDGICAVNVQINESERTFLQNFTRYLNYSLQSVAMETDTSYVDISKALYSNSFDYRLCGASSKRAINGITNNKKSAREPNYPIDRESFHPNQFGHELIAENIRRETDDLQNNIPASYNADTNEQLRRMLINNDAFILPTNPGIVVDYNNAIGDWFFFKEQSKTILDDVSDDLLGIASRPADAATVSVELHSSPINVGILNITQEGIISGDINIPADALPGYHQLHYKIPLVDGTTLDIYRIVYVAQSSQDPDGDGLLDGSDPCPYSAQSFEDKDHDSVDDACDSEILDYVAPVVPNRPNGLTTIQMSKKPDEAKEGNSLIVANPSSDNTLYPSSAPLFNNIGASSQKTSSLGMKQDERSRDWNFTLFLWPVLTLFAGMLATAGARVVRIIKRK